MAGGTRSSTPTTSRRAGTCGCPPDAQTARGGKRRAPRGSDRGVGPHAATACPSWSPWAWGRSPAPHWPAAPGAAAGSIRSPATRAATARCPRRRSTRPRSCTASQGSRHCTRSRRPTACSAGRCRAEPGPAVRAVCVSPLRRHVLARRAPGRRSRWVRCCGRTAPAWHVGPRDARGTRTPCLPYVPSPSPSVRTTTAPGWSRSVPETCSRSWASRRRPVAVGASGRGCLGLVGHGAGDRRPGRPRAPRPEVAVRLGAPAPPVLRRPARSLSPAAAAPHRGGHHRDVAATRPDGAGRPQGGHAPSDGPGGAAAPPVGGNGPADRRSSRSARADAMPAPTGVAVRRAASRPRLGAARLPRAGPVDVRLLTMTPRLDGLREDLPPNRARRAVELVAYLALHQPDVITGDRLRTRVLGSSDADAASKTLFNTAYAARRAMGADEHGDPLFPAGTAQRPVPGLAPGHGRRAPGDRAAPRRPGADRARSGHRPLPRRARAGRGRAAGQRAVGLFVVGGRGSRRAHRRRARGRRLRHGGAGVRCGASSTSPGGASNRPAWSSPTARRSRAPPCSWLPPRVTRTGSASNGASASAASTRWTPVARPRRAPSPSTASSAGGSLVGGRDRRRACRRATRRPHGD